MVWEDTTFAFDLYLSKLKRNFIVLVFLVVVLKQGYGTSLTEATL